MTDSILRKDAARWRQQLVDFTLQIQPSLPTRESLTTVQDWHRRITGGVLIQFFDFLQKSASEQYYPQLADHPLSQRLFLFITDAAGLHAAEELMDTRSLQACCILQEQWRAFLEDPNTDDDDHFIHHYQFWSVWHQKIPQTWNVPPLSDGFSYWIHEEGFALADGAGRGAQHLWKFDGQSMKISEEMMTSWTS